MISIAEVLLHSAHGHMIPQVVDGIDNKRAGLPVLCSKHTKCNSPKGGYAKVDATSCFVSIELTSMHRLFASCWIKIIPSSDSLAM
jgi:hypothetical protein